MSSSFGPELAELRGAGVLDEATASRVMALDSGAIFSLFEELRVALYLAVALIVTGLGIVIEKNLDRIGPITFIVALALVAAACYAPAIRAQLKGRTRSIGSDYLLLLGALILSADLGYAEMRFDWFGAQWSWHLLILAMVHAVTAYLLNSRLVLAAALTAFAGWLGISRYSGDLGQIYLATLEMSWRAFICAGAILVWRAAHVRLGARQAFTEVFDHFIANLAFWAALIWCSNRLMRLPGVVLITALAVLAIRRGMRTRQEIFVVYGVGYGAWGYCILSSEVIHGRLVEPIATLIIVVGAAVLLWTLHGRLKEGVA